jgi:hypothetical protein
VFKAGDSENWNLPRHEGKKMLHLTMSYATLVAFAFDLFDSNGHVLLKCESLYPDEEDHYYLSHDNPDDIPKGCTVMSRDQIIESPLAAICMFRTIALDDYQSR